MLYRSPSSRVTHIVVVVVVSLPSSWHPRAVPRVTNQPDVASSIDRCRARASSSSSSSRTVSPRAHHHHHAPARVSSRPPRPLTPRARPDACAGSAIGRAMGRFVRRVRPARAIADATADLSLARASSDGWTCAMAWRRSRATSTTSRETSSDDADDADADDADALDVEVEVAREGCGRDRWRRTRGDAWGGCVPGRDWSMGSCDTFKTRRSQRLDDWTTTRTHKKTVGRTRSCVGIFKYASSRRERRGMIGEASADEARKPWRWFWC